MKKNDLTLTKEDFSFVCPLKTEDMNTVDGGYFCGKCDKKVHDITNMAHEDFKTLQAKSENLCITFHKVAAVSLVLGLTACTSASENNTRLIGEIASPTACDANITQPSNRLAPFSIPDKNKTITIDHIEEPQISGGMVVPIDIPKQIPKKDEEVKSQEKKK